MKWHLCTKMRLGIWCRCWLKGTHWQQMGVEEEDKCRRKGGEIQSSVGSKRLFLGVGNSFW